MQIQGFFRLCIKCTVYQDSQVESVLGQIKILLDVSRVTPRLGWPMAGRLSKAFCTAICVRSERKIRVRQVKKGRLYKGRRKEKEIFKNTQFSLPGI